MASVTHGVRRGPLPPVITHDLQGLRNMWVCVGEEFEQGAGGRAQRVGEQKSSGGCTLAQRRLGETSPDEALRQGWI